MCYVSTLAYVGSENIPFSTKTSLILLMSATFFLQKIRIFSKNNTFTQSNSMDAVLEILYLCFHFL